MRHALYLAFCYIRSGPMRSIIVVLGLGAVLFLPLFSYGLGQVLSETLLSRGESSPILVGHKGNEFDLTMNALYFRSAVKDPVPMKLSDDIFAQSYGVAVPLYIKHTASGAPVVGTSIDYFTQRQLTIAKGRHFAVLGEIVVGGVLAESYGFSVGDTIRSDSENLYNISGSYPMMLTVVGILNTNNSPDDKAIFADVKTIWAIDGYFHGHEAVTSENSINEEPSETENLEASAAIFMFQEFDLAKTQGFHMHGDVGELPLSSVLVFPDNSKHHDQILGDYALSAQYQAVRPVQVIRTILGIVLRVQDTMVVYFGVILASTGALLLLIFQLSFRLRAAEFQLIERMGGSAGTIRKMVLAELGLLFALALSLAGVLSWVGLSVVAQVVQ